MRDPYEQLHRIQNAIIKIGGYTRKGRLIFNREEEVRLSVIHYLYTIGEAAYAIPQDFKDNHPEIPWKQLVSFRNFLTFYYIEIDKDAVWKIIEHDLPNLKPKIDLELEQMARRAERGKNIDSNVRESQTAAAFGELLQAKREDILRTAIRHGAFNVRVFGSVARGEADAESDIDLLVDIEPGRTLFDLSELLLDLQELLGHEEETQNSIIYYLQIVGEAASAIPQDFKDRHPEIPWRPIISMRNKLIHHYDGIDLDVVWETATVSIPDLQSKIDAILDAEK